MYEAIILYAGIPEINKTFAAYQSERKTLSMRELNLPVNTLSGLGMKGITPQYALGRPEIQEQIAFGKAIGKLNPPPHPLKTHIEYFALKIPLHIAYIRNGIKRSKTLNSEQKQTALYLLDELEQEAWRQIGEKAVTYSWWLRFNLNLVKVISEKETVGENEFFAYSGDLLSVFPVFLSLPAIQGELGKAVLSRAFANRILPMGLVTEPTKVDGMLLNPLEFAKHDLNHANGFISSFSIYHNLSKEQAMNTNPHVKFMETLQRRERKQAEDHYFELIHEAF